MKGILIPRVPGTPGHTKVKTFIIDELQQLGWTVTTDKFTARVPSPFKKLPFESIVATPNPNAERYLVYAAHYDSKYFANDPNFVAATDSAVACAMMLTIAKGLQNYLNLRSQQGNDLSILLVFFDGEEAIDNWSASDSIYGARHLAKRWEQANFLEKIDMMVLLDLIGAPDPKFYSFFKDTEHWYSRLVDAEQKLGENGQLSRLWQRPHTYFQPSSVRKFGILLSIEFSLILFYFQNLILKTIIYHFYEEAYQSFMLLLCHSLKFGIHLTIMNRQLTTTLLMT